MKLNQEKIILYLWAHKTHSAETLAKMSIVRGSSVYVYSFDKPSTLIYTFSSTRKAAEHFECSYVTIAKYIKNGKLFQEKWVLSYILK